MISILFTVYFIVGGIMIIFKLLPGENKISGIWLGIAGGTMCEMWLPVLFARLFGFTIWAHIASAVFYLIPFSICFYYGKGYKPKRLSSEDKSFLRMLLIVCIPLTILSGYNQYTHMIMPRQDGSYWCGQSTYGDLCMHLAFLTSFKNAPFPPSYPLLYDTSMSYPYLSDSFGTTFYLLGMPLSASVAISGTYLMGLTYAGFMILGRKILGNHSKTIAVAALFFFLNGGLGFLYDFDLAWKDHFERVLEIFSGYYKTPANQPEFNLRFSNVIADLMIPQRSLLGGWSMIFPALYLLIDGFKEKNEKKILLLSLFAGGMPLLHTHTFLALGLFSGGFLIGRIIEDKENRKWILRYSLVYLGIVLLLGLPQLLGHAVKQTLEGGSLRFQFNWVNNSGGRGMIDGYLWFWIKNAGLPYLLMLISLPDLFKRGRGSIFLGMSSIYLVAELILFQPNEYDNNKLFYIWYIFVALLAAEYGRIVMSRLNGLNGRYILAGVIILLSVFSGTLSLIRETISSYQLFSNTAVSAGNWIEKNTEKDSIFMTGQQHINPVVSLAGRQIICGSDLYVFFHGLHYQDKKTDCERFYENPEENLSVLKEYNIDYIYVSDYERSEMPVDLEKMDNLFSLVYENRDVKIYEVSDEYK